MPSAYVPLKLLSFDSVVVQGSISVPGTIGALFINKTADVVEGFDRSKPLVYNVSPLL